MITIISGTNRPGSNTHKVASNYQRLFAEKGIKTNLLSLNEHDVCYKNEAFFALEKEYLIPLIKGRFLKAVDKTKQQIIVDWDADF
jgi:hypothetical protein